MTPADIPEMISYCLGAFFIGYASSWILYVFRRVVYSLL